LREFLFVCAALTFGYYIGYTTRAQSETDPDLQDWIPFNDTIVNFISPVVFCVIVIAARHC
jgi:hypothetical protein